jgi:hypothetical protein
VPDAENDGRIARHGPRLERDGGKFEEATMWVQMATLAAVTLVLVIPASRAAAVIHNLTVVTRNVRDFEVFGVRTLTPFQWGPT